MTDHSWFADEVRQRTAAAIGRRHDVLAADLDVLVAAALPERTAEVRARLAGRIIDLLALSLAATSLADHPALAELAAVEEAGLRLADVFAAVRLAGRSFLEELALEADIGATSEHWPVVTALLRNASFDLLAQYCERRLGPQPGGIIDRETTLFSRQVFDIAASKELQRASRYRHPTSLILFAVDNLAAINEALGYGVGERVLERLGVFMRGFFREPDWVSRYGPDSITVLLAETSADDAHALAEGARQAIAERLVFPDKDDRPVVVTVSAAVVSVTLRGESVQMRESLDPQRVMAEAEAGLRRARARGGNTTERVQVARDSLSISEAAALLHCSPATVRALIGGGTLPALKAGRRTRVDRAALEAYAQRRPRPHRSSHHTRSVSE